MASSSVTLLLCKSIWTICVLSYAQISILAQCQACGHHMDGPVQHYLRNSGVTVDKKYLLDGFYCIAATSTLYQQLARSAFHEALIISFSEK